MQRHDQRAKRIAEQALDLFGDVTREFAVPAPDDQRGDLWFQRTRFPTAVPSYLRLFDALFPSDAMLEAYWKAVDPAGLWSSTRKQLNYFHLLAKRDHRVLEPPPLWLLSAGRPEALFDRYHLRSTPSRVPGCYELCQGFAVHLLVINELPLGRETLIFRLMGAGLVLKAATDELRSWPREDPEYRDLQRFVACLRQTIKSDKDLDESDKEEFIMTSAWAEYERYEQQIRQEGHKAGREDALREAIAVLCEVLGIPLSEERQTFLQQQDLLELNALLMRLKRDRAWSMP